ncbi:UDP-glucuronosyltransferase [Aphelenchoides fujianensis]|nr:UDP-glucuronosyltransferase [Aphelenchoides fujianensis]
MLEAFSHFPDVLFLMKYERPEDGFGEGVKNLRTAAWFPQKDLLRHPKLLAFVTHAGMSSVNEALRAGVPVLLTPLTGDQPRNARMVAERGCGLVVEKAELTADRIAAQLARILDEPHFRERARSIARMLADKPMDANEKVVRYAEFAAKYDVAEHLDLHGRQLNFFQYFSLDVFLFFLALFAGLLFLVYRILKCLILRLVRKRAGHSKMD